MKLFSRGPGVPSTAPVLIVLERRRSPSLGMMDGQSLVARHLSQRCCFYVANKHFISFLSENRNNRSERPQRERKVSLRAPQQGRRQLPDGLARPAAVKA